MNDRINKIKADIASLGEQVKPFAEQSIAGTISADDSKRFDELVVQLANAKADLNEAVDQYTKAQAVLGDVQSATRPADNVKRDMPGTESSVAGETAQGYKSPGTALIESESFQYARKNTRGNMASPVIIKDGFFGPDATKAVIGSATVPGSALFAQVLPGIYRGMERPLVLRDVLMNLQTTSDNITVMQENVFTNSAAEVAEATLVSNGAKPESAITFTEATFPVQIIAHWLPVTRQLLEDLAFMRGYIDDRLLTGLRRREDAQFLNGNGTAPNIRGILQTSGIQNLDQTYFTGAAVKNVGTDNENINRIRRGIRVLQVTGQSQPSFIVMNPADAENIDTSADADRQYLLGGPLAATPRRIWGLPIVESDNMAAGGVLIGDGQMAAVVDRGNAAIYTTDSHSDFFVRNLFVVLAEERVALPVFRPAAFAFVDLA